LARADGADAVVDAEAGTLSECTSTMAIIREANAKRADRAEPGDRRDQARTRQKLARKSARIAHGLPSDELASCGPGAKRLQMRTIFRVQ
jgi:hypothetical protein